MLPFSYRPFSIKNDLQIILQSLADWRPAGHANDFPAAVDLHEAFSDPCVQRQARMWYDADDRLIAWAFVDPFNNLCFELDPARSGPALEEALFAWAAACRRLSAGPPVQPTRLDASCPAERGERVALLKRFGFELQAERALHMVRTLKGQIPEPVLPPGFYIRPAAGEQEAEALAALHRAAFGSEYMTAERRLAIMHTPDYEPALDLVAVAPNGDLAAYCIVSISDKQGAPPGQLEGATDPVATHPAYRRLGLAKALLLSGLQLLKRRDAGFARLGASSENYPMQRAAEAAGFKVESTTLHFSKFTSA